MCVVVCFFFFQPEIVLMNVKEEIFSKSCAVIGWLGPDQIVRWRGTESHDLSHRCPVLDKEVLCNVSLPNL